MITVDEYAETLRNSVKALKVCLETNKFAEADDDLLEEWSSQIEWLIDSVSKFTFMAETPTQRLAVLDAYADYLFFLAEYKEELRKYLNIYR